MASKIPLRPDDKSVCKDFNENERNTLTYYVLFGCTKDVAFELHNAKRLVSASKVAITKQANQFFASPQANAYIKAYRDTLERFLAGESKPAEEVDTEQNAEESKKRRRMAVLENAYKYVEDRMKNISTDEDPELIIKMADKMGYFENLESTIEAPRRYLPQSCYQGCRYRLCVEENILNGNIVDECDYCKYKAYANKNGVVYDNMHLLDIPTDSI